MAKTLAGVMAVSIAALLFAGCGGGSNPTAKAEESTTTTTPSTTTPSTTTPMLERLPSEPLSVASTRPPSSPAVVITWSPPQDDGGSAIIQYRIDTSLDNITWTFEKFVYFKDPLEHTIYKSAQHHVRVGALNGVGLGPFAQITVPEYLIEPYVAPPSSPQDKRFIKCMSDMAVAAINGRNFYRDCASEAFG